MDIMNLGVQSTVCGTYFYVVKRQNGPRCLDGQERIDQNIKEKVD